MPHFKKPHTMARSLLAGLAISALCTLPGIAAAQPLAVIMSPTATAPTIPQVANVYLGRSFELKPFDLPETSPLRTHFYKSVTDKDADQVKAAWSRVVFTGKGQPPKQLADSAAVKKAVAADPKAIGYINAADVDSSVKVIFQVD
jgi:hypothetical protein